MKKLAFGWIFAFLGCLPLYGGKYFDFSASAQDAYQKAVSLRMGEAHSALEGMRRNEPDNLIAILIENYIDFLSVFAGDRKSEYNRLSRNMEPRLDKIARGDRRSPYHLYAQAEIRLQWAFLRSRFGDYLAAMSDIKQAYALLEENQRRFPDFIANKKSLGIMHALIGNVPEEYRWAVKALGGMRGSTEQGLRELEEVLNYARHNPFVFEDEATAAYALLQSYLNNQPEAAWKALKNSKLSPKNNAMAAYAMTTVAMRAGQNDEAIRILQEIPSDNTYLPLPYQQYTLGLAKLRRLDADAGKPLENFVNQFKGENGLKEAYQKLAWYHLISGDESGYRTQMIHVKSKGASTTEQDKVAQREAASAEMPDVRLLRARLLFDGGYYQRAYDLLTSAEERYAGDRKKNLEYTYRMGRILHKLRRNPDAIRYYTQTINAGAKDPWFFACNAALQLGLLYEEIKDYAQARRAYNRCMDMKPEEYTGGLHAQAKAGLGRIKGR